MTKTLYNKNVILRNWYDFKKIRHEEGLDSISRRQDNGENYMTLTGTKPQINRYLAQADIVSERLRTLNNLPKFRIFNTTKIRIQ